MSPIDLFSSLQFVTNPTRGTMPSSAGGATCDWPIYPLCVWVVVAVSVAALGVLGSFIITIVVGLPDHALALQALGAAAAGRAATCGVRLRPCPPSSRRPRWRPRRGPGRDAQAVDGLDRAAPVRVLGVVIVACAPAVHCQVAQSCDTARREAFLDPLSFALCDPSDLISWILDLHSMAA